MNINSLYIIYRPTRTASLIKGAPPIFILLYIIFSLLLLEYICEQEKGKKVLYIRVDFSIGIRLSFRFGFMWFAKK